MDEETDGVGGAGGVAADGFADVIDEHHVAGGEESEVSS